MDVWVLVQLPVKFSLNLGAVKVYLLNSFELEFEL